MIVFIASNDFNPNPRTSKYIEAVRFQGLKYLVIGWDRNKKGLTKKNYIFFKKRAKYGAKYRNLVNKITWMIFVFKTLFGNRKNFNIIHATDFDSALPSMIFSCIFRKEMIFDIADWIGNSSKNDSVIIKIIEKIQNVIVKNSDTVIICESERRKQITEKKINRLFIMPNIPNYENNNILASDKPIENNYKYIISYVGVFDYNRGIENLLKLGTENPDILLIIAGYGALEDIVIKESSNNSNIKFLGKVSHQDALNIISSSDLLYACYHLSNPVHKYAAPNKFYESLICSVPIITTKNTLVGENVIRHKTGYVIDDSYSELERLIQQKLEVDILKKKDNCKRVWDDYYKDYINNFMNNEYIPYIKSVPKEK